MSSKYGEIYKLIQKQINEVREQARKAEIIMRSSPPDISNLGSSNEVTENETIGENSLEKSHIEDVKEINTLKLEVDKLKKEIKNKTDENVLWKGRYQGALDKLKEKTEQFEEIEIESYEERIKQMVLESERRKHEMEKISKEKIDLLEKVQELNDKLKNTNENPPVEESDSMDDFLIKDLEERLEKIRIEKKNVQIKLKATLKKVDKYKKKSRKHKDLLHKSIEELKSAKTQIDILKKNSKGVNNEDKKLIKDLQMELSETKKSCHLQYNQDKEKIKKLKKNIADLKSTQNLSSIVKENFLLKKKILEMTKVIHMAIVQRDQEVINEEILVKKLMKENKELRKLLNVQ